MSRLIAGYEHCYKHGYADNEDEHDCRRNHDWWSFATHPHGFSKLITVGIRGAVGMHFVEEACD